MPQSSFKVQSAFKAQSALTNYVPALTVMNNSGQLRESVRTKRPGAQMLSFGRRNLLHSHKSGDWSSLVWFTVRRFSTRSGARADAQDTETNATAPALWETQSDGGGNHYGCEYEVCNDGSRFRYCWGSAEESCLGMGALQEGFLKGRRHLSWVLKDQ